MKLNYRKLGSGHPLIILHGLYGAGDNWLSIGRSLAGICEVYLLDLRNHGESPHSNVHDYDSMMRDVKEFVDDQEIDKFILMGHSMGGKTAMRFALEYPGMLSSLIVVDISPGSYVKDFSKEHIRMHKKIIESLLSLDLGDISGLSEAEQALAEKLPDMRLRKFLLKNLRKDDNNHYSWKINLPVLKEYLTEVSDGLDESKLASAEMLNFPSLFIRGEKSDYILEEDIILIKKVFPLSNIVTIKKAGHWLHAEQPQVFTRIVKKFILS